MKTINVSDETWDMLVSLRHNLKLRSMDALERQLMAAHLTSEPLAPSLETPKPKPKPKDSKTDEQRIAEGEARLEALKARLSGGEPAETLLIGEGEQVKPEARGEKIKIAYTDD